MASISCINKRSSARLGCVRGLGRSHDNCTGAKKAKYMCMIQEWTTILIVVVCAKAHAHSHRYGTVSVCLHQRKRTVDEYINFSSYRPSSSRWSHALALPSAASADRTWEKAESRRWISGSICRSIRRRDCADENVYDVLIDDRKWRRQAANWRPRDKPHTRRNLTRHDDIHVYIPADPAHPSLLRTAHATFDILGFY